MSNGDDQRGTGDRGAADRGVAGARPVDPVSERGVERASNPRAGAHLPPAAPASGAVDPRWLARQENVGRWIGRRERFLQNLTRLLRTAAPQQFSSRTLAHSQAELRQLEDRFAALMRRYAERPRALSVADRREAIRLHDAAYALSGRGWDGARQSFWQGLYNSPQGQRLVEAARREGVHGLSMIRITDAEMRNGRAPRILDFDNDGRPRYVTIDIDHMTPRERNPFHAYRPDNLRLQTAQFNRRWLNPFSAHTAFPMGRYGRADAIEEFVQAHQLSRRQRPAAERARRGSRAAGAAALIFGVLFAAHRSRGYAQVADELRAARRRRQHAGRPPIRPHEVDAYNVGSKIESVFARPPVEVDAGRAGQLRLAVRNWVHREYRRNGSGWRDFESRFAQARGSEEALDRLLVEVGHVNLRYPAGLVVGDLAQVPSIATFIEDARTLVRGLLRERAAYLDRAEAAARLSQLNADVLEQEAQSLGITLRDMMTIYDHSRSLASSYRRYVSYLDFILAALEEAARCTGERFRRIQAAIDAAAGTRGPQRTAAGADVPDQTVGRSQ